jgi:hypothetical protein
MRWLRAATGFSAPGFFELVCPLPLADYPTIVMGHGGGGKLGNELVEHLFLPAFRNPRWKIWAMRRCSICRRRQAGHEHRFLCRAAACFFPAGRLASWR